MTLRLRWFRDHRAREHRTRQRVAGFLFGVGILLLVFCAFVYFTARVSRHFDDRDFELHLAAVRQSGAPPIESYPSRLKIPRLGISVMVYDGVRARTLSIGAGHIPGTSAPGERGNIGIAAHRDTFFRGLKDIRPGDIILLETLQGSIRYAVQWTRVVQPSDRDVLESTADSRLTLVTCYPFYYIGSAPERFIVQARQLAAGRLGGE